VTRPSPKLSASSPARPIPGRAKDPINEMRPVCGPPRFRLGALRRSHALYLGRNHGAGDGNRTRIASLEGVWHMAVKAAELGTLMLASVPGRPMVTMANSLAASSSRTSGAVLPASSVCCRSWLLVAVRGRCCTSVLYGAPHWQLGGSLFGSVQTGPLSLAGPPCTTQYGVELQPELQPCALSGAAVGYPADFGEVSPAPGLGLGDQGQDPGLGVRLLLARCCISVRDHLPDLLAPEGALLVRRELDAEALVKKAPGVLAARSPVGRHTHPRDS
jgi:hypothetical protein